MIDIDSLIENARKTSNKEALRAFQNIKAKIQIAKTSKNGKNYNESDEIRLISNYVKSLQEDIKTFSEAHRDDLISEYTSELEVLKQLVPEPPTSQEIENFIEEWGKNNGKEIPVQIQKKEFGPVIKAVRDKFPQCAGDVISHIIKKHVI